MTALLVVEWRRIVARRLARALALIAALAIVAASVIVFLVSHRTGQAQLDRAEAARQASIERCLAGTQGQVPPDVSPEERVFICQDQAPVVVDRSFRYDEVPQILMATSPFTIMLSWLLGASAIGAEWHAGTVTTLLTWEPRRLRLLAAKAAAAAAFTVLLTAALFALLALALVPSGLLRGSVAGTDLGALAGVVARGAAVSGLAALIGFAIAAIGRNTAAALGVGFLYVAVIEGIIRGVCPQWARWLMGDNAAVVITNRPLDFPDLHRTTLTAALLLSAYAAVLVAAALAQFRRRDVT